MVLDATPLLGVRTGIGRYVEHLLAELADRDDVRVAATAFTLRGWRALSAAVPSGVDTPTRPFPARLLRMSWRRWNLPPVEWLSGRADVFHGTNFVLPPTRRAAGVLSVHDLAWLTHPHTLHAATADLATLVPRGLRRARAVTTLAEVTKTAIHREFGVPLERIFVAPPGVDERWHRAVPPDAAGRRRLALPERYLLFVGTREPRKGLPTLLAAYRRLRAEDAAGLPDLVLAGAAGWGADPLAGAIPDGVRAVGYVDQADLPGLVAGALALVLPSVDEGFGMTAVEALAAGTPVVVSDIPVLAEVTGTAALRFPVGDAEALARVIAGALRGDGPAAADRRDWARRFSWSTCADQNVAAYRFALDGPAGRRR